MHRLPKESGTQSEVWTVITPGWEERVRKQQAMMILRMHLNLRAQLVPSLTRDRVR